MTIEVRRVGVGGDDVVLGAGHLFDSVPSAEWTADFLGRSGHHLLVAFDGDRAVND